MALKRFVIPTLNQESFAPLTPSVPEGTSIPKVIHQTCERKTALTPRLQENIERMKALNPGWRHRLYDDADIEEFILRHYPSSVFGLYRKIDPNYGAARADLFRYLLIYKMGGVYLDIKSTAMRPLDDVLTSDDRFLLAQWTKNGETAFHGWGIHHDLADVAGGEYQQWHIIASPGHPFLKNVIEYVLRNIQIYNPGLHGTGKYGVLRVTGPVAYTLAIHRIREQHKHRIVDSDRDLSLAYSILSGDTHMKLFKAHYSELIDPIVRVTAMRLLTARIYHPLQSAWSRMKRQCL